jgi:alpha-D-ribose 1-methylphosphonate 5-triphosphate diphosphatase
LSAYTLSNIRLVEPGGTTSNTSLTIEDGRIRSIGEDSARQTWECRGLLALPGIVDLHGDAFERQLMPRPGVHFDTRLALLDTDRQLISNGITTAYHGLTYSWEPGLRSCEAGRAFIAALEAMQSSLACDTRLHLRWETFNLDVEDEIVDWLTAGRIALLAFNDHTPGIAREAAHPQKLSKYAERSGLSVGEFADLVGSVYRRRDEVASAVGRLAAVALTANVPMASHDDASPEERNRYARMGCRISEFPKDEITAQTARDAGHDIVMGAPNVVRGRSHLSAASAAHLIAKDLCTVLTSDYYYPSLAQAAFRLVRDGICDLASAWRLISENPAKAAWLDDRGVLAPGKRADIVLIDDSDRELPRTVATVAAGKPLVFGNIGQLPAGLLRAAE